MFVNTNKKFPLRLATHRSFSLWTTGFLIKFVSKQAQKSTSFPPVWTVFSRQAAISLRRFLFKWLPASLLTATLGYGCSWAVLFWAKHAPNSENNSSEDGEVDNRLEKYILLILWRMWSQLLVFVVSANFESDRRSHKHGLAAKYSSKWWPLKSLLSRRIRDSRHFRDWNFDEWKSWMFTWYRRRQKSKLFGVTSFKCNKISKIFFCSEFSCKFSRVGLQLYV